MLKSTSQMRGKHLQNEKNSGSLVSCSSMPTAQSLYDRPCPPPHPPPPPCIAQIFYARVPPMSGKDLCPALPALTLRQLVPINLVSAVGKTVT